MPFVIELDGQRALVTGAGQGVGRGVALALARAGAEIVVNDLDEERASPVVEEIIAAGGAARTGAFDVTNFDAALDAVADVGGVDILVNNAGNAGAENFLFGPFDQSTPDQWDRYFAVNLFGVLHCTRASLPGMIERGHGRVITIVSEAARSGEPGLAAYSAAKAGAAGFTRAIAKEVGRHGITANNIALGTIDRPEVRGSVDNPKQAARYEKQVRRYLAGRLGTPDDVAGLVTYMASPLASWLTGQTYPLNGGYALNQ